MSDLRQAARAVLENHWRDGYCAPNLGRYPWQWLWDSCFHAVVWAELGDERALEELRTCFRWQAPNGFVPHMGYQVDPAAASPVWGRAGASTLTQPPMYGHALAELGRRGFAADDEVVDRAVAGVRFLLDHRRDERGLVVICHPWESGADDTPRWDSWRTAEATDREGWLQDKLRLLGSLRVDAHGAGMRNPSFEVAAASFNALVAFNAAELATVTGDAELLRQAEAVTDAVEELWDDDRRTWVDVSLADPGPRPSTRVRTLDSLLVALVSARGERVRAAFAQLDDHSAFGARFGLSSVHRQEPAFDPSGYWRGSAWPHLNYLAWLAARRHGFEDQARRLAAVTVERAGATAFAEHWNPDTGEALGAIPQAWATLALLLAAAQQRDLHTV